MVHNGDIQRDKENKYKITDTEYKYTEREIQVLNWTSHMSGSKYNTEMEIHRD